MNKEDRVTGRLDSTRIAEINLEQALLDFEVANARVLDLTQRLTELNAELLNTRQQLESVRLSSSQAQTELAVATEENRQIKSSLAYRGLRFMGDARARMKR
ncbi:MAG: hypothetical protein M0Z30_04935 [Actinomycetota bacterium]|nr:hypothetical protein [Actinomycetota bacterium]